MAKKLKCWVRGKKNSNRWFCEKRKEVVEIRKLSKSKDYVIDVDNPSVGKGIGWSRSKSGALKKANSYMRKHDIC